MSTGNSFSDRKQMGSSYSSFVSGMYGVPPSSGPSTERETRCPLCIPVSDVYQNQVVFAGVFGVHPYGYPRTVQKQDGFAYMSQCDTFGWSLSKSVYYEVCSSVSSISYVRPILFASGNCC